MGNADRRNSRKMIQRRRQAQKKARLKRQAAERRTTRLAGGKAPAPKASSSDTPSEG